MIVECMTDVRATVRSFVTFGKEGIHSAHSVFVFLMREAVVVRPGGFSLRVVFIEIIGAREVNGEGRWAEAVGQVRRTQAGPAHTAWMTGLGRSVYTVAVMTVAVTAGCAGVVAT